MRVASLEGLSERRWRSRDFLSRMRSGRERRRPAVAASARRRRLSRSKRPLSPPRSKPNLPAVPVARSLTRSDCPCTVSGGAGWNASARWLARSPSRGTARREALRSMTVPTCSARVRVRRRPLRESRLSVRVRACVPAFPDAVARSGRAVRCRSLPLRQGSRRFVRASTRASNGLETRSWSSRISPRRFPSSPCTASACAMSSSLMAPCSRQQCSKTPPGAVR